MVATLIACAMALLAAVAEGLHARRCRKVAALAFGPKRRAAYWAYAAAPLRVAALGALTWGLITLMLIVPKARQAGVIPENEYRHLLLVLDVSPSMRLHDAGPTGKQSRRQRAADLMKSFFERIPVDYYKMSVLATYTSAKPVVVDTTDMEIIRNILSDLPMEYAFESGPTNLFAGIQEAAKLARPWKPKSTVLMLVTDGDTVPSTGMPKLPDAISGVLVIGVGDPVSGSSIDGHQSRQDASTLRQLAVRLGGEYYNGNEKQLPTGMIAAATAIPGQSVFEKLTKREYALLAVFIGAMVLAVLPLLLHYFGTRFAPGVSRAGRVEALRTPRGTVQRFLMSS